MATVQEVLQLSPEDAGRLMTPEDFDAADGEEGWRYELIRGVLIVSPIPKKPSRGMAGKLMHFFESYADDRRLSEDQLTVMFEEEIRIPNGSRRRCDVAVWIALSRKAVADDAPTITVEFVSKRKADIKRDYVDKRADYWAAGVQEYWIIDRHQRRLTALRRKGRRWEDHVVAEGEVYRTPLLPGFRLNLSDLFARADAVAEED
jgi:Uma2 family endonuclease